VGTPDGSGIPLTPAEELAAASDPDLAPLPDLQSPVEALESVTESVPALPLP
jgi:hypothetical protein